MSWNGFPYNYTIFLIYNVVYNNFVNLEELRKISEILKAKDNKLHEKFIHSIEFIKENSLSIVKRKIEERDLEMVTLSQLEILFKEIENEKD
jgi:hypothetical protein